MGGMSLLDTFLVSERYRKSQEVIKIRNSTRAGICVLFITFPR